ncbi:MAG: hypothetical protein KBD53_05520 [Candidatus Omnitrophica bacterium]|nr:hypothetical protein [Candidatus Omnitrophota bacterium]
MPTKKIVIFICVLFIGFIVYISSSDKFKEAFNNTFKESFKKNFLLSCTGTDKSEKMLSLCTCIADETLKELTVEELKNMIKAQKYIEENIVPKCVGLNDAEINT